MWNKNDYKDNLDWSFENWGILNKYSPLFIGLVCGFGIVLLIMSTVMLWRYCEISASTKLCCKGTYNKMTTPQQKPLPMRRESIANQTDFVNFQKKQPLERFPKKPTLQHSATVGSMFRHSNNKSFGVENKLCQGVSVNNIFSKFQPQSTFPEPVLLPLDHYTSHLYLEKLETSSEAKNSFRSTPSLEDLYAKVSFSKKRKNRMRKNDAAVIAISKSQSGQNNSLELYGSAIVVYNERTAL